MSLHVSCYFRVSFGSDYVWEALTEQIRPVEVNRTSLTGVSAPWFFMVQRMSPQMLSTSKGLAAMRPVTDVRFHDHGDKFRATDTVVFADGIPRFLQSREQLAIPDFEGLRLQNIND